MLQTAADHLSPDIIRKRLDYWTLVLGPKFSKKDRAAIPLRREYSLRKAVSRQRSAFSKGPRVQAVKLFAEG